VQELTPKEEVKRRLRMVLVADRCGMSPASLSEMKRTIVKALQVGLGWHSLQWRPCVGSWHRSRIDEHRVSCIQNLGLQRGLLHGTGSLAYIWLQDFVDIEGEEGIEVSITNEPGLGTVYSVNIPVSVAAVPFSASTSPWAWAAD
jgi:hypothetical protein